MDLVTQTRECNKGRGEQLIKIRLKDLMSGFLQLTLVHHTGVFVFVFFVPFLRRVGRNCPPISYNEGARTHTHAVQNHSCRQIGIP